MNRNIKNEEYLDYMKIYCCGDEEVKSSVAYGPTVRDHHLIHYVFSGKGKICIYGKWYECQTGSIIWVPPFNPVKYVSDNTEPWHYAWIGIAGGEADIIANDLGFSILNPTRGYDSDKLNKLFTKLLELYEENNMVARLKTLSLFYEIIEQLSVFERREEDSDYKIIDMVTQKIRTGYMEKQKIEDIAKELRISRSYLHRIFKEKLGISPKQLLTEYRLSIAFELLRSGNLSIEQVSTRIGYNSVTTFSAMFKKQYGLSPRDYMKEQRRIK